MRSYEQWCGVAKALDVVGDRWSLLIVRELSIRGALRYTDLHRGVPGIATNLLADRIRELEQAGIVARAIADAPGAPQLIRLTERGDRLRPVLDALGGWGAADLPDAPRTDAFQAHWLTIPLEASLRDRKPDRGRAVLEVRAGDPPIQVEVGDGVRTRLGPAAAPDGVISGDPRTRPRRPPRPDGSRGGAGGRHHVPRRPEAAAPHPPVTAATAEARFEALTAELVGLPGVTPPEGGRGFGASALKVDGKIFAMVSGGTLVVKLPRTRVDELVERGIGTRFEPGTGRVMREWLELGATTDDARWSALAREALAFVGGRA